ncbi:hypothetical protein GIB67_016140 [Kingdonia uniflora]|uniref:Uncharacterized protein n=1 Tax=Kingdonia uniflora TaxID=39325 RepID=A0A7J7N9W9_9MAGN|nr:hypothetical protein GIB67_016140 [Kingdonia uniflora]
MFTVEDSSTQSLGDTLLLGQYQFSTLEKTVKHNRVGGNEKEDRNRKKVKLRTWHQKNQKIEEKKKIVPGEGLEVVKYLMVDDDVEVNLEAISSEYGGGFLKWKKGDENDNDDKKDVEDNVKSEEEQPQVAEEEDSKPQTMVVAEVAKTDIVFFNQEEVVGKVYQASTDQTNVVSVKEQIVEVKKVKDEACQASEDQIIVVSTEEQTIEVTETDVVISHQEEDVGEASLYIYLKSKEEVVEGKDDDDGNLQNKPDPEQLVLMESKVDVTLKKKYALTEDEINERAFIMACQINQFHAHLDELLPGVLLESFIQRPISLDEKN